MSTRTAALAVDVTSNTGDAVSGLQDVGKTARTAGDGMASLGRDAEESARKLNVTADSADELGGKAGKATGALGALSSGFELAGAEKYAGALQGAALATDFMSGVGDSLNLVMESTILKNIRTTAATIARTAAEKAAAAGTAVMTAAQWALNAALNANPIALIVIGIVALVAGLVLAYKKSETFRNIVQAVGRAGAAAIGWVVDKVSSLVGWVRDRLPGAFGIAKTLVVGYLTLITLPIRTLITVVGDVIGWVRDKLPGAFRSAKTALVTAGEAILKPFQSLFDLIKDIIEKIKNIKLPKIDLNPFNNGRSGGGGGSSITTSSAAPVVNNYTFEISGILDADDAAVKIQTLLDRHARLMGAT